MNIFPSEYIDLIGNSSIGIFGVATDNYCLFPTNAKKRTVETAEKVLKVPIIKTSLVSSQLVGIFAVGNNHSLLLPELVSDDEFNFLRKKLPDSIEISILNSKISALGNTIVSSEKIALVHPEFTTDEIKTIEDSLDVEVIPRTIYDSPLVGSLVFRTSRGLLAHPSITDEELDWLLDLFGVGGNVTTVNRGTPYPRPGLIGNSSGVLVGSDTTGPEMMRIYQVLS